MYKRQQLYLYKIIRFIATKEEYNDIGLYSCGQVHNAPWLTLANRICRLYISTEDPEENLQTMTNFIIFYFAPSWFDIKHHSSPVPNLIANV